MIKQMVKFKIIITHDDTGQIIQFSTVKLNINSCHL